MFSKRKPDPFFSSLLDIAKNVQKAAHFAQDTDISTAALLKDASVQLKKFETDGDSLVHDVTARLNQSFMTPIEREDILQLAIKMDDILDGIEQLAAYMEMFSFTKEDTYVDQFMENIVKSTDEIVQAMELLSRKKLVDMRSHAVQIKEYERICDEVFRTSIKQLFMNETDPILIIQHKEMYEQLEEIADYCQDVANTIESIIMRNA